LRDLRHTRAYSRQQRPDISHVYTPMTASYSRLIDMILFLIHACGCSQPERATSEVSRTVFASVVQQLSSFVPEIPYLARSRYTIEGDKQADKVQSSPYCIHTVYPYLWQRRSNGSSEQYRVGCAPHTYGTDHCDVPNCV
jgi:hypothetical protein